MFSKIPSIKMKFFYALISIVFLAAHAHAQIRIGGSDLLESNFAASLVEYAASAGLELEADFKGSYPALRDLKRGDLDLAIVAIPNHQEVPEGAFRSVNIASKILTIAVPPENPLNQITIHQLWAVFGDAEGMTRWGELGLTGDWAQRSIVVRSISRAEHTLAVDLFSHHVLSTGRIKPTVVESPDIEGIRRAFSEDAAGIALLDRMPADSKGLKILPIARRETDFAHDPTPEAVSNDDYPLRLPIYMVFPTDQASDLKELLRYILSSDVARALEAEGLTPRARQHRDRLQLEFERF